MFFSFAIPSSFSPVKMKLLFPTPGLLVAKSDISATSCIRLKNEAEYITILRQFFLKMKIIEIIVINNIIQTIVSKIIKFFNAS